MPKISTPLVSNVIRSSAENTQRPALNKITTKNSSASMRSGEVRTLGSYLVTKAKDFADYVDKLMSTDKRPRNFVNVEFSRRVAASYQINDNPPLKLNGHKFTDLNVMQIDFPVGVEMPNCWIKAEEKPMKWIGVSFSDANLSGIKIEGGLEGSRSRFSSIGFSSVNLQHAEISDIKFSSSDVRVFDRVDLRNARFNNVSFEGAPSSIFKLSNVNLKDSKINNLSVKFVDFVEEVNITGSTIEELLVEGPCNWSCLKCANYREGAISWNRSMFDNAEGLKKSLSPENGAIVLNLLSTMKRNNRDIVVDLVSQMAKIITDSPALVECYHNEPLRRALIAELRDRIYEDNKDIQEFRERLLFQHYRYTTLNPSNTELDEAWLLLRKLPVGKLLQVQVVFNQVVREHPQIWSRFSEHKELADLPWLRKKDTHNIPHLFFNPETWEVISLEKRDFDGLVRSHTPPRNPEQIKYHASGKRVITVPAEQDALSRLRSELPLFNRLWERSAMSLQMVMNGLFTPYFYSGLSAQEKREVNGINHHIMGLLAEPYGKKMDLTSDTTKIMLHNIFSPLEGENSQQIIAALVEQAGKQLRNHPAFRARPAAQQQAIAALVMMKLCIELSTEQYCGAKGYSAVGLLEPALHLLNYACKACPGMFDTSARVGWHTTLAARDLKHSVQVTGLLSRINQYQFPGPDGLAIKAVFDAVYPLPQ